MTLKVEHDESHMRLVGRFYRKLRRRFQVRDSFGHFNAVLPAGLGGRSFPTVVICTISGDQLKEFASPRELGAMLKGLADPRINIGRFVNLQGNIVLRSSQGGTWIDPRPDITTRVQMITVDTEAETWPELESKR
jgi:hypothetical protein